MLSLNLTNYTVGERRRRDYSDFVILPTSRAVRNRLLWSPSLPMLQATTNLRPPTSSEPSQTDEPRICWDLIEQITQEADPATLAVLCKTSRALLEVAGPLLYKRVEVTDRDTYRLLLVERAGNPLLGCISQHLRLQNIKFLTLHVGSDPDSYKGFRAPARLAAESRILSLDELSFVLGPLEKSALDLLRYLPEVVPYLNPKVVRFVKAVLPLGDRTTIVAAAPMIIIPAACFDGWDNLKMARFEGVLVRTHPPGRTPSPRSAGALVSSQRLFGRAPSPPSSTYICNSFGPAAVHSCNDGSGKLRWWEDFLLDLVQGARVTGVDGLQDPRPNHIELVVESKADIEVLQALILAMKSCHSLNDTSAALFRLSLSS